MKKILVVFVLLVVVGCATQISNSENSLEENNSVEQYSNDEEKLKDKLTILNEYGELSIEKNIEGMSFYISPNWKNEYYEENKCRYRVDNNDLKYSLACIEKEDSVPITENQILDFENTFSKNSTIVDWFKYGDYYGLVTETYQDKSTFRNLLVPSYGKYYQIAFFSNGRQMTNEERGYAYNIFNTIKFDFDK